MSAGLAETTFATVELDREEIEVALGVDVSWGASDVGVFKRFDGDVTDRNRKDVVEWLAYMPGRFLNVFTPRIATLLESSGEPQDGRPCARALESERTRGVQ